MRWWWSLLLVFVLPSVVHAECREVVKWSPGGGSGLYDNSGDACLSIKPDNAIQFAPSWFHCYDYMESCTCQWEMKNSGWPPVIFGKGTVHRTIVYEGDSCPKQCVAGEYVSHAVTFDASNPDPNVSDGVVPLYIDYNGCLAELSTWPLSGGCFVSADDPSQVTCVGEWVTTGQPSSGSDPESRSVTSTGVTDTRQTHVNETSETSAPVSNPDGSTTTTTTTTTTVSNPPSATITETATKVSIDQTSDTSYVVTTTTTTTTTYPDGTKVVVTETTREVHQVPVTHTDIDKTTGHISGTTTPGKTDTGKTTTTTHIDSDGNVTSRTTVTQGGGGQGSDGIPSTPSLPDSDERSDLVRIDESGMPADPGGDQFGGLVDGTGIDSLLDGLASPPSMPSINPLPDLPDGGGVCQTLTLRWRSWSLTFPDSEQCAKLHQMQEYLAWALYIWTVYGIFAMITTKKES